MASNVRLVCFDWGGVILRICGSWTEACAAAGLPVRPGSEAPELAIARRDLAQRYQVGQLTCDEFFTSASEACRGLYTSDEIRAVHDAWLLHEYPGIPDLLERLTRRPGIETALLSNTNHRHWSRHLPRSRGVPADFPAIGMLTHRHASHLLKLAKPDPGIYEALERATGYSPAEILFFDDLPDNIAAARARGWQAEQIDPKGDTAAQIAAQLRAYNILD